MSDGSRLLITGGCHGNELEGPLVGQRLIDWLPEAPTCGKVVGADQPAPRVPVAERI
ncbi:MAG: hypothetical protein EOR02_31685 [Mesorhizobium sp.]|nr:succinylglutamate desuccinylase/aspartoacylase family protein [Mesorhizobium sp.]RWP24033.1 MAG: hypothetical protein EOR02_31685 [Mesorhizobium sp.]